MTTRNVLVVGGTGYLGTLVRELVRAASPWHTVQILTRSAASAAAPTAGISSPRFPAVAGHGGAVPTP